MAWAFRIGLVALAGAICPVAAWSATTSIGAARDNTIYASGVNNSAGGAAGIFSGTNGQGSARRGLLAFDVAGELPSGATVTSAALELYLAGSAGNANANIGLHRLNADWGEGTAGSSNPAVSGGGNGFAAAEGDATWNARFHSTTSPTPWSTAGATGDFDPVASASAMVGGTGAIDTESIWLSTPGLVADVQSWLHNPATNFGWALVNADETSSQTVRVFYSSEATLNAASGPLNPEWRPRLVVEYVVPEPASALLALLAWFAVGLAPGRFRARRRLGNAPA